MLHTGLSRPVRRRAVTCLTAAVAASVLLVGCALEPPTPAPEAPVVAAVVSTSQEREILDRVSGVVEAANTADKAGSLAARLSGPALPLREAELKLAAARGDNEVLSNLTAETQQVVLPSDREWPRTSYAITVHPKDLTTPVLMAFEQATARDQYKLWGWVDLVPDLTMPQFAQAELGNAAVPADDKSLKVTPEDAIKQYASVLTVDERSKHAGNFADDYLRETLRKSGKSQVAEIEKKDGKGSFEVAYEPTKDPVKAVRTVDGGALVLAAMRSQETLTAEENWELRPLADSARALWGDAEPTNVLKIAYQDMVALYVPPAGSDSRISLVGVHRVPYAVSND